MARLDPARTGAPLAAVLALAAVACAGATPRGPAGPALRCPSGAGLCLALSADDCRRDGATCRSRPLRELGEIVVTPLDRHGVAARAPVARLPIDADGQVAAALRPGRYRLRASLAASFGFDFELPAGAPLAIDTRTRRAADGLITGRVRVAVGGGAEGNTAVSDGGPGAFLVLAVLPVVGERGVVRARPRFVVTDADGAFAVRVPPGTYHVSDLSDASPTGRATYGTNQTPVRGRRVEVRLDVPVSIELGASSAAP